MWELPRLAREANLGLDQVVRIKSIFDSFDDDGTGTLDLSVPGTLGSSGLIWR